MQCHLCPLSTPTATSLLPPRLSAGSQQPRGWCWSLDPLLTPQGRKPQPRQQRAPGEERDPRPHRDLFRQKPHLRKIPSDMYMHQSLRSTAPSHPTARPASLPFFWSSNTWPRKAQPYFAVLSWCTWKAGCLPEHRGRVPGRALSCPQEPLQEHVFSFPYV